MTTPSLPGHLITPGRTVQGFDCNTPLTSRTVDEFKKNGYQFVVRYVRRATPHSFDLSAGEAATILESGLGLMAVQHVESAESWTPSPSKGTDYGHTAAIEMAQMGFPPGAMCWLDLEGVAKGVEDPDVIDYCNNWHRSLATHGYLPGLYVGWHPGLNAHQLYYSLRFTHYWAAYNLNADQYPLVRGVQMQQGSQPHERPDGVSFEFDSDVIHADKLGSWPVVLAKEGWLE